MRFGNAGGDGADPYFGNELYTDACRAVGVLQVMDQFREILDGINIMVRRRRDQAYAGRSVADLRDPRINFSARQLTAFTRLRALGHFDLKLLGVAEVVAGYAETAGRDLFDGAVFGIAVWLQRIARRVLTAFTGVALAAEAVHGNGQRLVRFL